jgi:hypothetical protein
MKEARKGDGGKLKAAAAAEEDYYVTFIDVLTPRRNIWVWFTNLFLTVGDINCRQITIAVGFLLK